MGRSRYWGPFIACFLVPLMMGAGDPASPSDDATRRNGRIPSHGHREIRLDQELWRTDPDDEPFFRSIQKVLHDPASSEYFVLDTRSRAIHVYDHSGTRLRSLLLEGDGPGQVESLADVQFLEGNQLGLLSPIGPTIVRITRQGDPVYNHLSRIDYFADTSGISNCYHFEVCGDGYVMAGEQSFQGHSFLGVYTDYGDRRRLLLDRPIHFRFDERVFDDHDDYLLAYKPWTVASNGLIYFCPDRTGTTDYRLLAVEPSGRAVRRIARDFERRKRTEREIAAVRAAHFNGPEALAGHAARGWRIVMPEFDPDVLSITELGAHLWVETSRSRDRMHAWVYDVFDLEGRFIEQATVHCPDADNRKDVLYVFDETVLLVKGQYDALARGHDTQQDALQLICYERMDRLRVFQ